MAGEAGKAGGAPEAGGKAQPGAAGGSSRPYLQRVEDFIQYWSRGPLTGGKSFEELFSIAGLPLWWFYRRLLLQHVIPKPVNAYPCLVQGKMGVAASLAFAAKSLLLRKALFRREMKKIRLSAAKNTKPNAELNAILNIRPGTNIKPGTQPNTKPKVLFLSYTNHLSEEQKIFRLGNTIDLLRRDDLQRGEKLQELLLFADALSRSSYRQVARLPGPYQYCTEELSRKARRRATRLVEQWEAIAPEEKSRAFTFEGRDLWPYFRPGMEFLLSREFLYLTSLYYEIFLEIIRAEKVKVAVITGKTQLFERCLLAAAKKSGIPAIALSHSIAEPALIERECPLHWAVVSEHYRQLLVKAGVPEEEVSVAGPVMYDDIHTFTPTFTLPKAVPGKTALGKTIPVLIATSPYLETGKIGKKEYMARLEWLMRGIFSSGEDAPGGESSGRKFKLQFKLHPRERHESLYRSLAAKYPGTEIFPGNISRGKFYSLIRDCGVFVHFGSNAALEAMIINRPVLTMNLLKDVYVVNHWLKTMGYEDAAVGVDYGGDISGALRRALGDEPAMRKRRQEIVWELCGSIDGKAAGRVVKLIYKLAS